jgi:hypothetical protein
MARKLNTTHKMKMGTIQVSKGTAIDGSGSPIYSWDVGELCRHQDCPAINKCHYEENIDEGGECKVMHNYMRSAALTVYENEKKMTSMQRYQVGMHIIPLYRILCKLKIAELGVVNIVNHTDRGTMQINPLYKEIRETIKMIDFVWKTVSFALRPSKDPDSAVPDFGDPSADNYYDAMEKEAFAETKTNVRPMRKKS